MPRAIEQAGLKLEDIALFEVNEAFSVVVCAGQKILGLNPEKVNVNG